jgi:excisionase family DNA binding protein
MPNHAHTRPIDHGFPTDERAEWLTFDDIANATYVPPGPTTISVTEAARTLGISRTTAYEAVRDGTLPSIRIRGRIVISVAGLTVVLNGRRWPR